MRLSGGRNRLRCTAPLRLAAGFNGNVLKRIASSTLMTAFAMFLGFVGTPAAAYADASTGFLEVCKTSDTANPVTGSFSFTVAAGAATLTRSVPVGACSGPIELPAGQATITEASVTGVGVNSITATGLTSPANRLVRSDLGAQTAVVMIVAGDISTETVATFRNFRRQTGFLEVCKDAAPGTSFPAGTTFTFTISGVPGTRVVPVGACSGPIEVPAGSVTITEAARPDASLVNVVALPSERLVSKNIGGLSAVVTIIAGNISTETVARFINTPVTGQLKICKIAGTGVDLRTNFTIRAGTASYQVPAGPAAEGGFCVLDGTFPVGTQVTVQETIPTGIQVQAIAVAPANRGGTPNLANGTVVVTIGTGFTEVTYTNREFVPPPPVTGQLKICKIAGPGIAVGTNFTITAAGPSGTQTYTVPAGPASEGGFCVLDGTFPVGTPVTVTEIVPSNARVTAIGVAPAERAGTQTPNSIVVNIGTGFTEVTFTNAALGTLQVCKVAGTNVTVGTNFTFSVTPVPIGGSSPITVAAGAGPGGTCSAPLSFLVGTSVSVSETPVPVGTTVLPSTTQTATISTTAARLTFTNNKNVIQACSPGFFKTHPAYAVSGVTLANIGFAGTPIAGLSLQAALENGGGGINALGREAAAAYLNLRASGISDAVARAQISALVTLARAGDQAAIAELERRINDSPCTLGGRADPPKGNEK
jgi:hypothetical protein